MIQLNDAQAEEMAGWHEHLAAIETEMLALKKGGTEFDEELADRAFRAVHSVNRGASFFELTAIRDLAHQTEEVLGLIRAGQLVPTHARIGVLVRAIQTLRELIQNHDGSNEAGTAEVMAALARLCATPGMWPQGGAGQMRALLVEDDFASRLLLQTFLSRYGECHVAVNGREAVDAFRCALESGDRYNLICMDIMMPEMDGREALRQIRALEAERGVFSTYGAKIIMTTALDEITEVTRCFEELCDAYLTKPIDLAKLLGQIKAYKLVR